MLRHIDLQTRCPLPYGRTPDYAAVLGEWRHFEGAPPVPHSRGNSQTIARLLPVLEMRATPKRMLK